MKKKAISSKIIEHVIIEEELEKARRKNTELLDSIRDGFFSMNHEWQFTYANRRGTEILGLSPERIIGLNIWESYPQLLGTEIEMVYRTVMKDRVPIQFEHVCIGSDKWFEIRVYPAGDGGISAYWIDRTKRKKVEEALRETNEELERRVQERTTELQRLNDKLQNEIEERRRAEEALSKSRADYKYIIKHAPAAIYEIDFMALRFKNINDVMCATTGYSKAEFLSMNPFSILDEESKRKFQNRIDKMLSGEKVDESVEYKVIAKDGREIWVVFDIKMIYRDEKTVGALVVGHDITERKKSEEALRESEGRFNKFMEHSPTTAWIKDEQGHHVYLSKKYENHFGVKLEEWLGKTDFDVWPRELAEEFRKNDQEVLKTGKLIEVLEKTQNPDRSYTYWLTYKFPFQDASGKWFIGGIGIDITERMKIEEALRQADVQKDAFLATLSHELRNPLSAINNSILILKRVMPEEDRVNKAIDIINRQVGQLTHLVDDLLDITRITQHRIKLKQESQDLNKLVRQTVEDYSILFEKNGVCLMMVLTPDTVIVKADAIRLCQIIGNLLHNAAKFSNRGDYTRISTEKDDSSQQAIIRVVDTGIGIAPEIIPILFNPFMQVDTSLDRGQGGLGLGLALSKGLIELHGGTIHVNSAGLGKGSEFVVCLPLDDINVESQPSPQEITHRKRRVLIIDDNIDLAMSLYELLKLNEHEVAIAYEGYEGLKIAREFKPDVLLCDIGLPGMDGYEVAKAFRADKALKDVYLVALTGYAQSTDKLRANEAGFNRHLAKPVNLDELERLMAEITV